MAARKCTCPLCGSVIETDHGAMLGVKVVQHKVIVHHYMAPSEQLTWSVWFNSMARR